MADHQHGAAPVSQITFQPKGRFQIQMVGRLVEQQQVGVGKQHGGQCDTHTPAAGKVRTWPPLRFLIEAKAGQYSRRPCRGGVGFDIGKAGMDIGDAPRFGGAFRLNQQG